MKLVMKPVKRQQGIGRGRGGGRKNNLISTYIKEQQEKKQKVEVSPKDKEQENMDEE